MQQYFEINDVEYTIDLVEELQLNELQSGTLSLEKIHAVAKKLPLYFANWAPLSSSAYSASVEAKENKERIFFEEKLKVRATAVITDEDGKKVGKKMTVDEVDMLVRANSETYRQACAEWLYKEKMARDLKSIIDTLYAISDVLKTLYNSFSKEMMINSKSNIVTGYNIE